ncbi:MAG: hypothetical protein ACRD22_16650, partial [Terriglobia bacterium]
MLNTHVAASRAWRYVRDCIGKLIHIVHELAATLASLRSSSILANRATASSAKCCTSELNAAFPKN